MKITTTKIYDLITSVNFENIKQKLVNKVEEHNWTIPERQEYTYEELINDFPDYIDVIKQNIEDGSFDLLSLATRQQIHQIINQTNTHLANIYANNQQFANLQDLTQSLITIVRANRLDFEARRIPRYKEKIKEYKELIEELNTLNTTLSTTYSKIGELDSLVDQGNTYVKELNEVHNESIEKETLVSTKLDHVQEMNNQVNVLLETIKEHRENINELLNEAKSSNGSIKEIEDVIIKFHSKIDEYKQNNKKFMDDTEENVQEFIQKTDEIIEKNNKQTVEIDNQLNKAVGASLFSTFATRKDDLNDKLKNWLIWLGIIIAILIGLSGWIAYDIIGIDTNWYKVIVKIGISFPLIYMLVFLSNRYTKERRLVEEYAFKSTISLALTPYADLVKKVEESGADSKYRDFLISSIENIFSVPTDKAFGFNKHDKKDKTEDSRKTIEEVLNIIEKATKIGKDIE